MRGYLALLSIPQYPRLAIKLIHLHLQVADLHLKNVKPFEASSLHN
jgi:hypothetical protein